MDRDKGLYQKYKVKKISNPKKQIDAIVLEFDDPIARVAIKAWADEMYKNGFHVCASETLSKCEAYEDAESET